MQGHDVMAPGFFGCFYMALFLYRLWDGVMDAIGNEYKTGFEAFRVGYLVVCAISFAYLSSSRTGSSSWPRQWVAEMTGAQTTSRSSSHG